jgi:hypothetical protein
MGARPKQIPGLCRAEVSTRRLAIEIGAPCPGQRQGVQSWQGNGRARCRWCRMSVERVELQVWHSSAARHRRWRSPRMLDRTQERHTARPGDCCQVVPASQSLPPQSRRRAVWRFVVPAKPFYASLPADLRTLGERAATAKYTTSRCSRHPTSISCAESRRRSTLSPAS